MFDRGNGNANLRILGERLTVLAEVLGGRAPSSAQAISVWADAMRGIPLSYAIAAVNGWASFHTKFPAPADIRKAAEEAYQRDREERDRQINDEITAMDEIRPVDEGIAEGMRRVLACVNRHEKVDKLPFVEAVVFHANYLAGRRREDVSPIKWKATMQAFPHGKPTDPAFIEECRQTLARENAWQMNLPRPSDYARMSK